MKDILDIISNYNMYILEFFNQYNKRKKDNTLYSKADYIPQNLIKLYYLDKSHFDFKKIIEEFKKKTIYNENKMENVKSKYEKEGLSLVYDKIENGYFSNIKHIGILFLIHQTMYSKMPYSNYGGKIRNYNAFISGTEVETTDYTMVATELNDLNKDYIELIDMAKLIRETSSPNLIIDYINKSLELKCKIIKIHPFSDGNGRTSRAMLNNLFKEVNLPPVYITKGEKDEYIKAMNEAVVNHNYNNIYKFYYYKICDSIYELDIIKRNENQNEVKKR